MALRRFPPPWSTKRLEAARIPQSATPTATCVPAVTAPRRFALHSGANSLHRPEGPTTMFKIIVLSCVLAAVAVTLKIKLDTPQGPQPLARAIVTTHLQQLRGELALP